MKKSVLLLQNTEARAPANQNIIEKFIFVFLSYLRIYRTLKKTQVKHSWLHKMSYTIFKFFFTRSVSQSSFPFKRYVKRLLVYLHSQGLSFYQRESIIVVHLQLVFLSELFSKGLNFLYDGHDRIFSSVSFKSGRLVHRKKKR